MDWIDPEDGVRYRGVTYVYSGMAIGMDGSYAEWHNPPLSLRQRWRRRLTLAWDQVRPCWRGWDKCDECGTRRDGLARAWAVLTKASIS